MPDPIPRLPRRDNAAADATSLFSFGRIEEQPVPAEAPPPSTDPFQEPDPGDEPA
jgi:hypothetical protein